MELFDIFCYLSVFAAICCLRYNPQPKPQIEPNYTPETQVEAWEPMEIDETEEVDTEVLPPLESPDFPPLPVSDPWDLPTQQTSHRRQWVVRHFSPILALPPATEPKPETEPETELTDLDSHQLRKLCTAAGVHWRNARGKNKHMTKAAMIANLKARVA
jgi:hypothetical protein